MNPNKGRVLISLALMVSGIVGVGIALIQSPRGIALLQVPFAKTEPVSTVKPNPKEVPQQSRSQEIANQLKQSNAAQLLKQLSNEADSTVKDSKTAIEGFIQRKTTQQRDNLKRIVADALREAVTGEVTQRSTSSGEFKGMKLTTEQNAEIQKAQRQMQVEMVRQIQNNPGLIQQLRSDLQQERLDPTLVQPIKNYSDAVAQVLTPQQQQKWQKNFDLGKLLSGGN